LCLDNIIGTASIFNRLLANQNIVMVDDDMFEEAEENVGRMFLTPIQFVVREYEDDDEDDD
jgi:hypothetical protein